MSCHAPASTATAAVTAPSVVGAKYYYAKGSCASAGMVLIQMLKLRCMTFEQVDPSNHRTSSGKDFYSINPKGNVPFLVLADGKTLNESAAVLQLLADQKPEVGLAGHVGTMDRYDVQNALNHLSSEVHVALRLRGVKKEQKECDYLVAKATKKLEYVNQQLEGKKFYVLDRFTVADCYLYFLISWLPYFSDLGLDLSKYSNVRAYYEHIGSLPQIQDTLKLIDANGSRLGHDNDKDSGAQCNNCMHKLMMQLHGGGGGSGAMGH